MGWREAVDSDGNVYYSNDTTGESQWEMPGELKRADTEVLSSGDSAKSWGQESTEAHILASADVGSDASNDPASYEKIIAESGLEVQAFDDLNQASRKAVELA